MNVLIDCIECWILFYVLFEWVWYVLIDLVVFGVWFGMVFDGFFVVGQFVIGCIVLIQVVFEVVKLQELYVGMLFEIYIEWIELMCVFVYCWYFYFVDIDVDVWQELIMLVSFEFEVVGDGILLWFIELGFDGLLFVCCVDVLCVNDGGWVMQMSNIEKYVVMY